MQKIFVLTAVAVSLLGSFNVCATEDDTYEQKSEDRKKSEGIVDIAASCMTLMDVAALLAIAPAVYAKITPEMISVTGWPYFSAGAGFVTSVIAALACSECGKLLFLPFLGEQWQRAKAENKKLRDTIWFYGFVAACIGFIVSR